MGQILIRKIDDEALERLRILAHDRNLSLEALAREAIESAARQKTQQELRSMHADLKKLRSKIPPSPHNSTDILRTLRDGDEAFND